jgi:DNA-binding NarL/FixJ family response regulator
MALAVVRFMVRLSGAWPNRLHPSGDRVNVERRFQAAGRRDGEERAVISGKTALQDGHIIIADDHPLFRGALKQAVGAAVPGAKVTEAGSFDDVNRTLAAGEITDLILLDLNMPGMQGFSGLAYLRASYPGVPVLVVSANEDPQVVRRCLEFGASGFLPKTQGMDAMREAVATVMGGGAWTPPDFDPLAPVDRETADLVKRLASLTPQQVRVLMMLSEGLLNKQIAFELTVSEATVKAHVSAILTKLGVDSRTQAVIAAAKIDTGQWQPAQG